MGTLFSMTGFSTGVWEAPEGSYQIEVKSLNHRFIEVRVRLPARYNLWEFKIIKIIKERFNRGRIDLSVSEIPGEVIGGRPRVDIKLAKGYAEILGVLKEELGLSGEVSLENIARMKDVIYQAGPEIDLDGLWEGFSPVLDGVFSGLEKERAREGSVLMEDIEGRLRNVENLSLRIEEAIPETKKAYREKLFGRIAELTESAGGGIDPGRIEQEVVIFAERSDITEELVRLKSHIEGFLGALKDGSPTGRKLDFYLQEMGREINTIGSKSSGVLIPEFVVEAKVELEKIREQVQNIE
jgi:uncharacterized protein (TIGR00255 family)